MKTRALELIQQCGVSALARRISAAMPRILVYHNFCGAGGMPDDSVSVTALRQQLEYVRRHFYVVKLSELCNQLSSGRPRHKLLALTADDGRRNFYEFLFPLLREFEIPATFFVVSCFVAGRDWLWTDKVLWMSRQPHRPEELAPDKLPGFFTMLNEMRPEARNVCIECFANGMGIRIPKQPPPPYAPCSWDELREMCDSGLVEIASHTVTHPILAHLDDAESLHEIAASRAEIEGQLGRPVTLFAIPNGTSKDYRPSQLQQIQAARYAGAGTAHCGLVSPGADPYRLPRIGIAGWVDKARFAARVDGLEHYRNRLRAAIGRMRCMLGARRVRDPEYRYGRREAMLTGPSD